MENENNLNGITLETVLAMKDALEDIVKYHSDKPTGFIEGHTLGGTIPFEKAKSVIKKINKELEK